MSVSWKSLTGHSPQVTDSKSMKLRVFSNLSQIVPKNKPATDLGFMAPLLERMRTDGIESMRKLQVDQASEEALSKSWKSFVYCKIARWPSPFFFQGKRLIVYGFRAGVKLPGGKILRSPDVQYCRLVKHKPQELASAMARPQIK
jgi:hypothetical protein